MIKIFNKMNVKLLIWKMNYSYEKLFKLTTIQYYRTGIFIDTGCQNLNEIQLILSKVRNNKFFIY